MTELALLVSNAYERTKSTTGLDGKRRRRRGMARLFGGICCEHTVVLYCTLNCLPCTGSPDRGWTWHSCSHLVWWYCTALRTMFSQWPGGARMRGFAVSNELNTIKISRNTK